jgi:hypothetical protein
MVNLGGGIVVWRGFKRSVWEGVGNVALNTLIAEAQIWTQPTRAIRDYENYAQHDLSVVETGGPKSKMTWSLHAIPGGFGIRILF